jgi:peptidoglycan/LPS O-acetylase OafA/YrhL
MESCGGGTVLHPVPSFLAALPVLFGTLAIFLTVGVLAEWGLAGNVFSQATIVGFSCINVGALVAIFEGRALNVAVRPPSLAIFFIFIALLIHPVSKSRIGESLYCLVAPFGVALVLMHTVACQGWLSSALKLPAIQWCGLVSYSAYLWQELFTGDVSAYGSPTAARVFHMMLPLLPLLAALSFSWVERPCTRFGRRLALGLRVRETVEVVREAAAT